MKMILVFCVVLAVALAAPASQDPKFAEILEQSNDNIGIGGYTFSYRTSDGTFREEKAVLKNAGTEQEALEVTGKVSWIGADGKEYTTVYKSNESGATVQGAHLPQ